MYSLGAKLLGALFGYREAGSCHGYLAASLEADVRGDDDYGYVAGV